MNFNRFFTAILLCACMQVSTSLFAVKAPRRARVAHESAVQKYKRLYCKLAERVEALEQDQEEREIPSLEDDEIVVPKDSANDKKIVTLEKTVEHNLQSNTNRWYLAGAGLLATTAIPCDGAAWPFTVGSLSLLGLHKAIASPKLKNVVGAHLLVGGAIVLGSIPNAKYDIDDSRVSLISGLTCLGAAVGYFQPEHLIKNKNNRLAAGVVGTLAGVGMIGAGWKGANNGMLTDGGSKKLGFAGITAILAGVKCLGSLVNAKDDSKA